MHLGPSTTSLLKDLELLTSPFWAWTSSSVKGASESPLLELSSRNSLHAKLLQCGRHIGMFPFWLLTSILSEKHTATTYHWYNWDTKKLHRVNVHNSVSLDICIHLCYHHHNQDDERIHHLQRFPCVLWLFCCWWGFCFLLFCFCFVVRIFNLRSTLLTNANPIWENPHRHNQKKMFNLASQVDIKLTVGGRGDEEGL